MKIIKKNVYYCDHCKKRTLSGGSMKIHEKRCTANPDRECKMCDNKFNIREICDQLKKRFTITEYLPETLGYSDTDTHFIEWIGEKITLKEVRNLVDNCPNCMLSVIRQCKFNYHYFKDFGKFDYKNEFNMMMAEKKSDNESYNY